MVGIRIISMILAVETYDTHDTYVTPSVILAGETQELGLEFMCKASLTTRMCLCGTCWFTSHPFNVMNLSYRSHK